MCFCLRCFFFNISYRLTLIFSKATVLGTQKNVEKHQRVCNQLTLIQLVYCLKRHLLLHNFHNSQHVAVRQTIEFMAEEPVMDKPSSRSPCSIYLSSVKPEWRGLVFSWHRCCWHTSLKLPTEPPDPCPFPLFFWPCCECHAHSLRATSGSWLMGRQSVKRSRPGWSLKSMLTYLSLHQ